MQRLTSWTGHIATARHAAMHVVQTKTFVNNVKIKRNNNMNLINLKKALDILDALEKAEEKYLEAHQIMDELNSEFDSSSPFCATHTALNKMGLAIDEAVNALNKDCEQFVEE